MMGIKKISRMLGVIAIIAFPPMTLYGNEDYKFKDDFGAEIDFPIDSPYFSQKDPGPWGKIKHFYKPEIEVRRRKMGLEDITYLRIAYPHPMEGDESPLGKINKLYILDKDDLVIAYDPFIGEEEEAKSELRINGIINYVQIYAESTKNGLWRYELRY